MPPYIAGFQDHIGGRSRSILYCLQGSLLRPTYIPPENSTRQRKPVGTESMKSLQRMTRILISIGCVVYVDKVAALQVVALPYYKQLLGASLHASTCISNAIYGDRFGRVCITSQSKQRPASPPIANRNRCRTTRLSHVLFSQLSCRSCLPARIPFQCSLRRHFRWIGSDGPGVFRFATAPDPESRSNDSRTFVLWF